MTSLAFVSFRKELEISRAWMSINIWFLTGRIFAPTQDYVTTETIA
jgi:hypothetical protein